MARDKAGRSTALIVTALVVGVALGVPALVRSRAEAAPVVHHILGTGQSLSQGLFSTPALTRTQPYDNLMLSVGWQGSTLVYTGLAPLVEGGFPHDGETLSSSLANSLTAAVPGYRSIVTRHGVSGFTYDQLETGSAPYADGMTQVATAHRLLGAQGIAHVVDAVTVVHGEADQVLYGAATAYEQQLGDWQRDYSRDVKAITGQTDDVVLFTDQVGSWHPTSAIPFAQLSAAEHNPGRVVLVGPKYFLRYAADGLHLSNEAERTLGEYYAKAYRRTIVDGASWRPFAPTAVSVCANVMTARFHVPSGPIVVDATNVSPRPNLGFEFADGTSSPPSINAVAVTGPDTVTLTLTRAPTGASPRLRYAFTAPGGAGQTSLAAGNLRDSDASTGASGAPLPNWLVHFDEPAAVDCTPPSTTPTLATTTTTTTPASTTMVPGTTTTSTPSGVTTTLASTTTTLPGTTTSAAATTTTTQPPTDDGVTVRYEAESAALAGPTVVTWGAGWTGAGWVTNWSDPAQTLTFAVHADTAGPATLRVRYKAPWLPAVRALDVNGVRAADVPFPLTPIVGGDWTNWAGARDASLTVMLAPGTNTIRLTRVGSSDGPLDLDHLDVTPATAPPTTTTTSTSTIAIARTTTIAPATTIAPSTSTTIGAPTSTTTTAAPSTTSTPATTAAPSTTTSTVPAGGGTVRLEAEHAGLAGPTVVTWGAGWSGTGWITGWNDPGQSITLTVRRAAAGAATLRVHYKAPFLAARRDLAIDGTHVTTLTFGLTPIAGGDWTSWAPAQDVVVAVTLPAGTTTVTLTRATTADGPLDLDYIDVVDDASSAARSAAPRGDNR